MSAPLGLAVEDLDPRELITDRNIRALSLDPDLVASIRDLGVLQPLTGLRTADGAVRILLGHRRAAAAIEAGHATVPVVVHLVYDDAGTADAERILCQHAENTRRAGLTAAEEAGVVVQLLDLGLTVGQVTRRSRIPRASVDAARAVRDSKAAAAAMAAVPQLTLGQAAAIAEFGDEEKIAGELAKAAADGAGRFAHTLQQARNDRAVAQARADLVAKLAADGVTVVDQNPDWQYRLEYLTDAAGKKLTPRGHKKCPGHVAYIGQRWSQKPEDAWHVTWYCADPKKNGHLGTRPGAPARDPAGAAEERREVIARNKEWRAAEQVRRAWLTEFLTRRTAPDGALRYILAALAAADGPLHRSMSQSHAGARELLGLPAPGSKWSHDTTAVTAAIEHVTDGRALVVALGLVLGATESETGTHVAASPGAYPNVAAYFTALTGWGYELSAAEQRVTGACRERAAITAAAGADAAGSDA